MPVQQAGFSGARIWKLTAPAGAFALRQWPAAGLERDRLIGLHQLLRHICDHGTTHVSCPVPALNGSTLVSEGGHLWQLEPWLPGEANYHAAPSNAKLTAALRGLAEWHRGAATFRPGDAHRRWFARYAAAASPGIAERLQLILDWNAPRIDKTTESVRRVPWPEFREAALPLLAAFQKCAPAIADELRLASGIRYQLQPCLRDVWHDHLLFVGDEVTGIIDPSACSSETVATDIARLVGSLVGDDRGGWEIAVVAYQTIRPLTVDELAAIELFDRSGVLLSGMTWVRRIGRDGAIVAEPERVIERMREILQRLQKLAASIV